MLEIFHLASEAKFDLGGQRSSKLKVAYLTKDFAEKKLS